nr:MAG TPA: hypothetical protein [Caudoviricetes sp.]
MSIHALKQDNSLIQILSLKHLLSLFIISNIVKQNKEVCNRLHLT